MKKLTLTALAIGLAAALQPAAHAQFGSGIVYDPTQSAHAVVQIEHEEQSISNQFQQIEQGQQIFTQHGQNRDDGATGLQRRQAAVQPRAPDDSRAVDAVSAVLVSHHRPTDAATDLEHLWQLDGMAQFGQYWHRGGSLLPASQRAEYQQHNSRLRQRQHSRPAADRRAGGHRRSRRFRHDKQPANARDHACQSGHSTNRHCHIWRAQRRARTPHSKPSWLRSSASIKPCSCNCAPSRMPTK